MAELELWRGAECHCQVAEFLLHKNRRMIKSKLRAIITLLNSAAIKRKEHWTLSIPLSPSPSKLGMQPCWVAYLLVCVSDPFLPLSISLPSLSISISHTLSLYSISTAYLNFTSSLPPPPPPPNLLTFIYSLHFIFYLHLLPHLTWKQRRHWTNRIASPFVKGTQAWDNFEFFFDLNQILICPS